MVLCQYFLNNSCRFGSKCNNEHLDVRATIKQEMEGALKGRQWPLSVFGPFKEKTNLITDEFDLSFEECRMQFLEAQASNTFPLYQQQLMQKIQEANARMQALLNVNKDVLQIAVNIYNDNTNAGGGSSAATSGGVFGTNTTNRSVFGGGSTSVFGQVSNQNNATSIFGGSAVNQNQTQQQSASSIFGGGTQSNTGFGSSASSIFGGGMSTNNAAHTSSIFGQTNAAMQQTSSIFGQSSTFGAPKPNAFLNANATPAFGSSAFGNIPTVQPSGLFSNAANSIFGSQNNATQNTFGMQAQSAPQQSAFGQPATLGGSASFGVAATPFGGSQLQQSMSQPVASTNIFGNLGQQAQQAALQSFTGQIGTQQQVQSSPFGAPVQQQSSAFGNQSAFGQANAMQTKVMNQDLTLYSKMEEISQEHLAAFQANDFLLGQIPSVPPPKELC